MSEYYDAMLDMCFSVYYIYGSSNLGFNDTKKYTNTEYWSRALKMLL